MKPGYFGRLVRLQKVARGAFCPLAKGATFASLAIAVLSLSACATRSSTEHAACVAPCAWDMQRVQFLDDIRQSGFESTKFSVVDAETAAALAAAAATDPSSDATAKIDPTGMPEE